MGLKDEVIRKIQGKLKATYEPALLKNTFKPLVRMYKDKFGKSKELESGNKEVNARASYL